MPTQMQSRFLAFPGSRLLAGLFLLAAISPARADTLLFSVSADQIMKGTAAADKLVMQDAIYAFFIQLDGTVNHGVTVTYSIDPALTQQNGWGATTFYDSSDPAADAIINGDGSTWVQFAGTPDDFGGSVNTSVISNAVHNGANVFLGQTYSDSGPAPVTWGTTPGTIGTIIDPSAVFQFQVVTSAHTVNPQFLVDAEVIVDHLHANQWVLAKPEEVQFTITATPEPSLFIVFAIGFGLLGLNRFLKRKAGVHLRHS